MSILKVQKIRHTASNTDVIDIANDGTCRANITNNLSNRRLNINGEFQVFQRSTSAAVDPSSGYVAPDRFRFSVVGSQRFTASQSTDVPAGYGFQNSLKLDCTTASGTVAGNGEAVLEHRMEGQDLQVFCKGTAQAKQYAFSFHVKSPKTGVHWVEFYDDDNNRHACKSYTISTANQWQKVTLTYPADTSGAFANDAGTSLRIFFWLLAGSNYTSGGTPSATWTAFDGDARATGQVNVFDSTDNDFYITGVQLEVGSVATDFEHRSYGQELALCQRYYYLLASGATKFMCMGDFWIDAQADGGIVLPVEMRATPTLDHTNGADYYRVWTNGTNSHIDGAISLWNRSHNKAVTWYATPDANRTAGHSCRWITNNASTHFAFSAEL